MAKDKFIMSSSQLGKNWFHKHWLKENDMAKHTDKVIDDMNGVDPNVNTDGSYYDDATDYVFLPLSTGSNVTLGPDENWIPGTDKADLKCTCGIDAIGGGRHSDWCDLGGSDG